MLLRETIFSSLVYETGFRGRKYLSLCPGLITSSLQPSAIPSLNLNYVIDKIGVIIFNHLIELVRLFEDVSHKILDLNCEQLSLHAALALELSWILCKIFPPNMQSSEELQKREHEVTCKPMESEPVF
jgi:hypothetical protein